PSYTRTLTGAFPYVYVLNEAPTWQSPYANTYVGAASATPFDMDRRRAINNGRGPNGGPLVHGRPQGAMQEGLQSPWAPVRADAFGPADALGAPVFVDRSF